MIHKLDKRLNSLSPSIYSLVSKIDELKGMWNAGARLHPQILKKLKESVLITSTGASTRIEGSKLSDEDVEKLLKGLSVQKFADRDKQEVRGYFELLDNLFNSWQEISLNESVIKHFHKELLKYVEKDKLHRGEYKKSENKVHMVDPQGNSIGILFDTTPAYLTPSEMSDLLIWIKTALTEKEYHPLLIIGNFIIQFLKIHPFTDGNGRISRILTNLLLLKSGYLYTPYISHEKIVEDNKPEYYLALRTSQKTFNTKNEDVSAWLLFFLKVILKQSEDAITLISNKNIEINLSEKQLKVWEFIKNRNDTTRLNIYNELGIAIRTINQVLNVLIKLKKIQRVGLGRSTRYKAL